MRRQHGGISFLLLLVAGWVSLFIPAASQARPQSNGYRLLTHAVGGTSWARSEGTGGSGSPGPHSPYPLELPASTSFYGGGFLIETPSQMTRATAEGELSQSYDGDGELSLTHAFAFVRPRTDFNRQALLLLWRGALLGYQATLRSLQVKGGVLVARVGLRDAECREPLPPGQTCAHPALGVGHYLLVRVQKSLLVGVTKLQLQLVAAEGYQGETASSG